MTYTASTSLPSIMKIIGRACRLVARVRVVVVVNMAFSAGRSGIVECYCQQYDRLVHRSLLAL